MKKVIAVLIFAAAILALAGCGAKKPCDHIYKEEILQKAGVLTDGIKKFTCTKCGDSYEEAIPATKSLKILAIGNSFSVDGMQYLWDICRDGGVENVILGNMYIGGCSLNKHWTNMQSGAGAYQYRKNTDGKWNITEDFSIPNAIKDEKWDIITVQQSSGVSGEMESYSALDDITSYIQDHKTNPDAKIYWHMTWAYQGNSDHKDFPKYDSDQKKMYEAIASVAQSFVLRNEDISGLIPSGTAIQNLRSSYVGDTVTRDGYHLSHSHGRYTAALTWFAYITGGDIEGINWVPEEYNVLDDIDPIKEAVANALKAPFEVTPSVFDKAVEKTDLERIIALGLDPANMELLDWGPTVASYWNSGSKFELIHAGNSKASNIPYFISSRKLTKEDLPVGSVIIVDSGYGYRPDGWLDLDGTKGARPPKVGAGAALVTENWWGEYAVRGFNLYSLESNYVMTDDDIEAMRIYVPKK